MAETQIPGLPELHWSNPSKPGRAQFKDDTLTILAKFSSDWIINPLTGEQVHTANALGFLAPEKEFSLAARVSVAGARTTFDAPVLVIWRDEQYYAKVCFEASPSGSVGPVTVVTNGQSDDANHHVVEENEVWLRVSKIGEGWAFHSSSDGKRWELLRVFELKGEGEVYCDFLSQSPTGPGCAARFENIALGPPGGLRDGT